MSFKAVMVDDEPHIRRVAELALRAVGCTVRTASNGQEAWDLIQDDRPDILVSDVQMPKIDGIQLVSLVRSNSTTHDLPIILLTAKGFELQQSESERLDSCDIVCKPFSPAALSRRAYDILSKQVAQPAAT